MGQLSSSELFGDVLKFDCLDFAQDILYLIIFVPKLRLTFQLMWVPHHLIEYYHNFQWSGKAAY